MFKFLDKWGREIRGKSITLIEVLICIGVVISIIIGVVQIKRTKGMSISDAFRNADGSDFDYEDKEKFKNDKLLYDLKYSSSIATYYLNMPC